MIMTTTNQRVDELMKEVQDLKTSLQFTQKAVDALKANYSKLSSGCNSNANDICKLAESLLVLDTKVNYLEQCFSTFFEPRYIFFHWKNHEAHHQPKMLKNETL